jgi:hypothetical protein
LKLKKCYIKSEIRDIKARGLRIRWGLASARGPSNDKILELITVIKPEVR